MGKKGKKGKGSGGKKKKGGKKGKKGEPQMSWEEALLAYKINIVEKQLEDVRYELRALTEKNERHKERNERLQLEQEEYIKMLLKQAKEMEDKLSKESVTEKSEVIKVMMDKWEAARQEERNIAELKERIAHKAAEIALEEKQVEYWTEYKNRGQTEHGTQIRLLERELEDMQNTFDEMAAHLERTLNQAKSEIGDTTEQTLDKQKYLATEKAMAKMDKYSRQEVLDNDWLKKEVEIHKEEAYDLVHLVEALEKDNLTIMSELFECQVDDLKISRNFFLTQFGDAENLEEDGILEMDLSQLSLDRGDAYKPAIEPARPARPKSAIHKAVEDKVQSLPAPTRGQVMDMDDEEESEFDGEPGSEDSSEGDPFENYFSFADEHFEDYLRLGPLELKLLNVTGQKMHIIKPKTPPVEEMRSKDWRPDKWPVTQPMLQQTVKGNTPRK